MVDEWMGRGLKARGKRQRGQGERVMGKGGPKFKGFRVEFGRRVK